MKANRKEQPQTIQTSKIGSKGMVKVWLRENIEQITNSEDETSYQYDEYALEIRDRPNLEQYLTSNFDTLLAKAKQDETSKLMAEFTSCLDQHIDSVAQAKKYDNRITASLRAAAVDSPWHAEGVAFVSWMDSCYAASHVILNDVQTGVREIPTKEELIAEMPVMVWEEV